MTPRPSSLRILSAFLKSLSLAKCVVVAGVFAQVPAVVNPGEGARIPNEAEACENALKKIHSSGLAERLQKIIWDDHNVDAVIADMERSGQIRTPEDRHLIDAQLRIGVIFSREGLLHEAIYQVFEPRYKTKQGIADAIMKFRDMSTAKEQGVLVSEVIERVLQYVPDIDSGNLDKIERTAKFINMTPSAMRTFRDRWVLYDSDDAFALILQNGISSILTSANAQLIADVQARGAFMKRFFGKSNTLVIPDRPFVINQELHERQVEQEDCAYYDDGSFLDYLRASSSAARRFFVMNRLRFLTRAQIRVVLENKEAWWLKPGLIEALRNEDLWREQLNRKFGVFQGLQRDWTAAKGTLDRKRSGESFDQLAVNRSWTGLREIQNPAEWRERATKTLEGIYKTAPARDFVGTFTNLKEAALPIHGKYPETMGFTESVVMFSTIVGLDERQSNKVKRDLTDLAEKFTGKPREALVARIQDLKAAPSYTKMSVEQLEEIEPMLAQSMREAEDDLERTYKRELDEANLPTANP